MKIERCEWRADSGKRCSYAALPGLRFCQLHESEVVKKHHVSIRNSGICGLVDTESSRATCSCGWQTGWDSGWRFVTRFRVWWHLRRAEGAV